MNDSIHAGHRERMLKKMEDAPSALTDHEVLEIALYPLIPRKNTNPLAHTLLRSFGSLEGVFRAPSHELAAINGIGIKTAIQLKAIGEIALRIRMNPQNTNERFTYQGFRDRLYDFFETHYAESFIVLLLDKKQRIVKKIVFDSNLVNRVDVDLTEFSHAIALSKPHAVVFLHNHPSGLPLPTEEDDRTTRKFALALSLQGVQLYDHIIVTEEDSYSYYYDGRLDQIMKEHNLERIMETI